MAPVNRRKLLLESTAAKLALIRKLRNKRSAVHEIYKARNVHGEFHHLYQELRRSPNKFFEYSRMKRETFDYLVRGLKKTLKHVTTNFQQPISMEERLIIALRYYATGVSFRQLSYSFRVGKTTVANIVKEVSAALWSYFQPLHMPQPTEEYFLNTAKEFMNKWQFPNCIGSIDGKHIRIRNPPNSGSLYYNYKNYFSIVLLSVTDARYRFGIVDVGAYGRDSDAGVFNNSLFYKKIESNEIILPGESFLPNSDVKVPHVFVGDEAFPLRSYLMRPYPARNLTPARAVFNEKLSRARRVVECSYGILASKWRILLKAIETDVDNAVAVVKATTILHNIIIDKEGIDPTFSAVTESMGTNMSCSARLNSSRREATAIRNAFCNHFNCMQNETFE